MAAIRSRCGIPRRIPWAQWRLIQLWETTFPSGPALLQLYVWASAHAGLPGGIVQGERGEEGCSGGRPSQDVFREDPGWRGESWAGKGPWNAARSERPGRRREVSG